MKNTYIGKATITYDEAGNVTSAQFEPHLLFKVETETVNKTIFKTLDKVQEVKTLQNNADMVLASWFNEVSEIELSDRATYTIASTSVKCDHYPSGNVKFCVLNYHLTKIPVNKA